MKNFFRVVLLLTMLSCHYTSHTFKKKNVNYLRKINKKYDEYVIHFEYGFHVGRGVNPQIKKQFGIRESLKKCIIQNKKITIYNGFSKFLNSSSESLTIISNNYIGNQPNRIDLHLILDDEETVGNPFNNPEQRSKDFSMKNNSRKLHNYNLYHYTITNPLINFEFMETIEYTTPSITNKELEDNFNFGKLFGEELCEALKNIH
ncbi:hypothetical protein [Leptospira bouyouniensis]|uniref:hypothetical protein n=1 Tax=Leptospira bouyouniensis TaxID=2484911 RepID=UPI0010911183|nr:hypothetical protein [Leptospira bouyouniensis]TGM81100.1 hypothetical protein EHQ99_15845 [Leptospira bouyouniensis]